MVNAHAGSATAGTARAHRGCDASATTVDIATPSSAAIAIASQVTLRRTSTISGMPMADAACVSVKMSTASASQTMAPSPEGGAGHARITATMTATARQGVTLQSTNST